MSAPLGWAWRWGTVEERVAIAKMIDDAIAQTGSVQRAAKKLGSSRTTLFRIMKEANGKTDQASS